MLDFPNSPNEGDTHTDGNQTWVFTNGAWVGAASIAGMVTEIVDADASAGWQVWGDALIQWGSGLFGTATNLPQPFANVSYGVSVLRTASNADVYAAVVGDRTETAFTARARKYSDSSASTGGYMWLAVGEAPDNLKKPKEVVGGVGTLRDEYHDPTGVASWRIVGNTLEMWGRYNLGGSTGTINLPKSVKSQNTASYNIQPENSNPRFFTINNKQVNRFDFFGWNDAGGASSSFFTWHVVGEWDGVS